MIRLSSLLLIFTSYAIYCVNCLFAEESRRVPAWVQDAVFYQLFPERFRNGDTSNDPNHASLEDPAAIPESWHVTPWTKPWYTRDRWEKEMGPEFL